MVLLNELGALWETELGDLGSSERFDEEPAIVTMHHGLYEDRAIYFVPSEAHVPGRVAKAAVIDEWARLEPNQRPRARQRVVFA